MLVSFWLCLHNDNSSSRATAGSSTGYGVTRYTCDSEGAASVRRGKCPEPLSRCPKRILPCSMGWLAGETRPAVGAGPDRNEGP